jgi:hypothetical protein
MLREHSTRSLDSGTSEWAKSRETDDTRQMLSEEGVERLPFRPQQAILGIENVYPVREKSFVGHPDAILFSQISDERVFQQPQDLSPGSAGT